MELDDVTISQRGQHVSKSTAHLACQFCSVKVSFPGEKMTGAEVVDIEQFCLQRNSNREKEGVWQDKVEEAPAPKAKKKKADTEA